MQPRAKPWVEWFANRIDDPVDRLKFLQAVTPLGVPAARPRRFWRIAMAAVLFATVLATLFLIRASARVRSVDAASRTAPVHNVSVAPAASVWLVDKSSDSETYSNGLRIDTRFEAPFHARSYLAFPREQPADGAGIRRDQPAGIVFHTTESLQAPFEPGANRALRQIGESLVDFIRSKHAYHYLIDRFGRVFRIVPETDTANHAGYSVWADGSWLYLNLNQSFLGVSFETQTQPGQLEPTVSPAQIRSAAMLTEMLRDRYRIPPYDCVTHAQVSVNPDNMRVGFHTDWASSFPFAQLGLPDNYTLPLPALTDFGFETDSTFLRWAGSRLAAGVRSAEQELEGRSAAASQSPAALRRVLQKRYRARLAQVRGNHVPAETSDDPQRPNER